jgi:hypothetical protein
MTSPGLLGWGDVAIGAAVRTSENAVEAAAGLRSRWDRWRTEAEDLRQLLAKRGSVERDRAMGAASQIVDRIVDSQLERVLRLLEQKPDRIRAIVRGQRENIVDEVFSRVRTGAAAGDEAVDRLTLRRGGHTPPEAL